MAKELKAVPKYIRNVARSAIYSGRDIMMDIMPGVKEFTAQNSDVSKNVINDIRNYKTIIETTKRNFDNSSTFKALQDLKKNAITDLKSGDFYNESRNVEYAAKAAGFDKLFDMDGLDDLGFDTSGISDDTHVLSKTVAVNTMASTKANITAMSTIGSRIAETNVKTANYIAENDKTLSNINMVTKYKMHEEITSLLSSVAGDINGIFKHAENQTNMLNQTANFYSDMITSVREQAALNKEFTEMFRNLYGLKVENPDSGHDEPLDIFGLEGTLNVQGYMQSVKKKIKQEWDSNFGGMTGAFGGDEGSFLTAMAGSPLRFISTLMGKQLVSKDLKQALSGFDSTFKSVSQTGLMKLGNIQYDTDNPLMEMVSRIFGVEPNRTGKLKLDTYEKGPIPYNGLANKALVEVIPGYLRKMLSAITNTNEIIYNYNEGKFLEYDDIKNKFDQENNLSYFGMNGMESAIKETLQGVVIKDGEGRDTLNKDIDSFKKFLVDNAYFFNPKQEENYRDVVSKGLYLDGGESSFNLIRSALLAMDRPELMDINRQIFETRDMRKNSIEDLNKDLSVKGYSSLFNGSQPSTKPNDFKGVVDKYNKSTFDYLRDIRTILLEGIKVYSLDINENVMMVNSHGIRTVDLDSRMNKYMQEVERIKNHISNSNTSESYSDNTFQKQVASLKAKGLDSLDEAAGMPVSSLVEILKTSKQHTGSSGNKEEPSIFKEVFGDDFSNSIDKFKGPAVDIFKAPQRLFSDIARQADNRLYELMYGKDGDSSGKGFIDKLIEQMQDRFQQLGTFMSEKILKPIHVKFFGNEDGKKGLIDVFKDKYMPKIKAGKEFIFGRENAFGDKKGGLLNTLKSQFGDMSHSMTHLINGKEYTDSTGKSYKYTDDNIVSNFKSTFKSVKSGVGSFLFGDELHSLDSKGNIISRKRMKNGFLTDVKDNMTGFFSDVKFKLFGEKSDKFSKGSAKNMFEEYVKPNMAKTISGGLSGAILGSLFTPLGLFPSLLLGSGIGYVTSSEKAKNWLFGDIDSEGNRTGGKVSKSVQDTFKKYVPSMGFGGIAGGLAGLLLPGSMLTWSFLGAGLGFAKQSEGFKDWLFGEKGSDGKRANNGVIDNDIREKFKKFAPSVAGMGLLGAGAGLVLPGSMLTWSFLGAGLGFAKESEGFKNWLFGDGTDKKIDFSKYTDKFKKALPVGIGATLGVATLNSSLGAIGSFLLPGGIIGQAALGLGIGMISQTDKVQTFLFGDKDPETDKRSGGLFGGLSNLIRYEILDPLKLGLKRSFLKVSDFMYKSIMFPIKEAIAPVKKQFSLIAVNIKESVIKSFEGLKTSLGKMFENHVTKPFGETMRKHLLDPMKNFFGKIFGGIGKFIGGIVSAPIKGLNALAMSFLDDHQKKGVADYMDKWKQDREEDNKKKDLFDTKSNIKNNLYDQEEEARNEMLKVIRAKGYNKNDKDVKTAIEKYEKTKAEINNSLKGKDSEDSIDEAIEDDVETINENVIDIRAILENNSNIMNEGNDKVVDSINNIYNILKEKITNIKDSATDKIDDIKTSVSDKIDDVKTTVSNTVTNVKDSASDKIFNVKTSASNLINNAFGLNYDDLIKDDLTDDNGNVINLAKFNKTKNAKINTMNSDIADEVAMSVMDSVTTDVYEKLSNNVINYSDYVEKKSKDTSVPNVPSNIAHRRVSGDNYNTFNPDDSSEEGESKNYNSVNPHDVNRNSDVRPVEENGKTLYGNLNTITSLLQVIADEVEGQLGGVGYHTEMVSNILVEKFGFPKLMPKMLKRFGRGNFKRGAHTLKHMLTRPFAFLKNLIMKPVNFVKNVIVDGATKIFKGISNVITDVYKGIKFVGKTILQLPGQILNAVSGITKMATQILKPIATFAVQTVKTGFKAINKVASAMTELVISMAKPVFGMITAGLKGIGKVFAGTVSAVSKVTVGFLKLASDVIPKVMSSLWSLTKFIGRGVRGIAKFAFNKVTGKGKDNTKIERSEILIRGGALDTIRSPIEVKVISGELNVKDIKDNVFDKIHKAVLSLKSSGNQSSHESTGLSEKIPTASNNKINLPNANPTGENGKVISMAEYLESKKKPDIAKVKKDKNYMDQLSENNKKKELTKKFLETTTEGASANKGTYSILNNTLGKTGIFSKLGPLLLLAIPKILGFFKDVKSFVTKLFSGKIKLPFGMNGGLGGNRGLGGVDLGGGGRNGKHDSTETGKTGGKFGKIGGSGKGKAVGLALAGAGAAIGVNSYLDSNQASASTTEGVDDYLNDSSTTETEEPTNTSLFKNIAGSVVETGIAVKTQDAKKAVSRKAAESLPDMIKNVLNSQAAQKILGKFSKYTKPLIHMVTEAVSKLSPKMIAKISAKLGSKLAAGAATAGIATAIFVGIDTTMGAIDTKKILKVPKDTKVTAGMRVACAIANFIDKNITFGFIDLTFMAQFIYELFGDANEVQKIRTAQLAMEDTYATDKQQKKDGKYETFEEYNRRVNGNLLDKTVDKAKSVISTVGAKVTTFFGGVDKETRNSITTTSKTLTGTLDSVNESTEKFGKEVQKPIEESSKLAIDGMTTTTGTVGTYFSTINTKTGESFVTDEIDKDIQETANTSTTFFGKVKTWFGKLFENTPKDESNPSGYSPYSMYANATNQTTTNTNSTTFRNPLISDSAGNSGDSSLTAPLNRYLNTNTNYEDNAAGSPTVSGNPATLNGMVYYNQGDARWGKTSYPPGGTIGTSGCGPTSAAMVVSSLTGKTLLPTDAANYSLSNGFRIPGAGTSWGFFKSFGSKYGVGFNQVDKGSREKIMENLKQRKPVIFSMGPGPFTKGGHFIVGAGVDGSGNIIINDPNSVSKSRAWEPSQVWGSLKQAWLSDKNLTGQMPTTAGAVSAGAVDANGQPVQQQDNSLTGIFGQLSQQLGLFADATIKGEAYDPNKLEPQQTEASTPGGPIPTGDSIVLNGTTITAERIDEVFQKSKPNGRFAGKGKAFIGLGSKYNVDPILMSSIMAFETGWGTSNAVINYNNPAGIMVKGGSTHRKFPSLEEGMDYSFSNMKRLYMDQGLKTIPQIAKKYAPYPAKNDPNGTNKYWPSTVSNLYKKFAGTAYKAGGNGDAPMPNIFNKFMKNQGGKKNIIDLGGNGSTPDKIPKPVSKNLANGFVRENNKIIVNKVDNILTATRLKSEIGDERASLAAIVTLLERITENTDSIKDSNEVISRKENNIIVRNDDKVTNKTPEQNPNVIVTQTTNPFNGIAESGTKKNKGYSTAQKIAMGIY